MSNILVNTIKDTGNNTLLSSDGSGSVTASSSLASSVQSVGGIQMTPSFLAYPTAQQSIANATNVKLNMQGELYDTDNCFDNVTNYRFTPTVAGKYYLFGCRRLASASSFNDNSVSIWKNGVSIADTNQPHSYYNVVHIDTTAEANGTTDYFELYCYQGSGGAINTNFGIGLTRFGAYRIIGA
jgi:hypothetical protein